VCSQLVVDNQVLQSAKLTLYKPHKSTNLYDMLYVKLRKSAQLISTTGATLHDNNEASAKVTTQYGRL